MPSSVYFSILQAVQSIVQGLGLVDWNGNPVPVVIRKLPKAEEGLDSLPLIAVVPTPRPPRREPLAFGTNGTPIYQRIWPADVVAVAAGDGDYTSNLIYYMGWHESIAVAFDAPTLADVPAVFDVNVIPDLVIDTSKLNDSYDYGGQTIEFTVAE